MPRPVPSALVALPLLALLAACSGGDATQSSVSDDVQEALLARDDLDLAVAEAAEAADCVARGMFESSEFTKEERNDATRAVDGDDPDPDLEAKVRALLEDCGVDVDREPG
jgi:hypothetical protein